jgi:class 3 adenylate cyclase
MPEGASAGPRAEQAELDRLLAAHAPASGRGQLTERGLENLGRSGSTPVDAVVVVGDLRMSTLVMREALVPSLYAKFIIGFTEAVRGLTRDFEGWFDKFTGDGFVALWIYDRERRPDIGRITQFCQTALSASDKLIGNLRKNSRNFPVGVGLSLGLDLGPCELVRIGSTLTIVGGPIVGATRMVSCAFANQTLVNIQLGETFAEEMDPLTKEGIQVERTIAKTKEYPEGLEGFRLRFLGRGEPALTTG